MASCAWLSLLWVVLLTRSAEVAMFYVAVLLLLVSFACFVASSFALAVVHWERVVGVGLACAALVALLRLLGLV